MATAFDLTSASVSSLEAAKWKKVKIIWPSLISGYSSGRGSFTLSIMCASEKIFFTLSTSFAPALEYSSSAIPLPRPAPFSTSTVCPFFTSSSAPTGMRATLYSSTFVSFGTPAIILTFLNSQSFRQGSSPVPTNKDQQMGGQPFGSLHFPQADNNQIHRTPRMDNL